MGRFESRLKRLEQARPQCPGVYKIEMFRVKRGCEEGLPPPGNHCLRCGLDHEPAGESQPVRRVIIVIPDGHENAGIPECGWRPEIMRGEGCRGASRARPARQECNQAAGGA
jgi:hypothetical protein